MKKHNEGSAGDHDPRNHEEKRDSASRNRDDEKLIEISSLELENLFFPPEPPPIKGTGPIQRVKVEEATPLPGAQPAPRAVEPANRESPFRSARTPTPPPDVDFRTGFLKSRAATPPPPPPVSGFNESPLLAPFSTQAGADITQVFFPANRLDEKGKLIPAAPADEESNLEECPGDKPPEPTWTIVLDPDHNIHFRKTVGICAEIWGIPEIAARRRIRFGKGILFVAVDERTSLGLKERFKKIGQAVRIYKNDEVSHLPEPFEIMTWLFSGRHFQVHSEKEKKVLSWTEVRLLCPGRARLDAAAEAYKPVLDVVLGEPYLRLRVWDATFNYRGSGITEDNLGKTSFLNLLKTIKKFAKEARLAPTAKEMLDKNLCEPKPFEALDEFENYVRWQYLCAFGVPMK